jgi:hypothetical protein
MTIQEIIRHDEDRVFVVDTECFIIFTGDSIHDRKPFIRIGNWLDLPIEIIPLIENIIVTDSLAGNPAHEQFNIDIKYLPTNRYIGSSHVVKRFLEYQSLFGLNLDNVTIIDADRDIPEITKRGAVSDNELFIGIFYRDGNFKVTHRGVDLFDLRQFHDGVSSDKGAHDRLSALAKPRRYSGGGTVIIEHNPFFYRGGTLVPYLFPHEYYGAFFTLGINPRQIAAVIHPSENYLGISRYLKWRHSSGGKITVYTDHEDDPSAITNLFSGVKINMLPFSGMGGQISQGVSLSQIGGSYNISGNIETSDPKTSIRFAFIKGSSSLKKIVKEKLDLVMICYSVYEDVSFILKSMKTPVVIVDDGNSGVRKIPALDTVVLRNNMQYEFMKCDEQELFSRMTDYLPAPICAGIAAKDFSPITKAIEAGKKKNPSPEEIARMFNALSLLRLAFQTTKDRAFSSFAKRALREEYASPSRAAVYELGGLYRIDLIISNEIVYEFARELQDPTPAEQYLFDAAHNGSHINADALSDEREYALYARIISDRKRLRALLDMFLQNPAYRAEVRELRKAIELRKKIFAMEKHEGPEESAGFIERLRETVGGGSDSGSISRSGLSRALRRRFKRIFRSPRFKKGVLAILLVFVIAGLIVISKHAYEWRKADLSEKARIAKEQAEEAERVRLVGEYHITVSEYDVYLYANETAVANGYSPIPATDLNKRNPHWIYPGNIFVMLDGERVTVREGDSLWKLARKKVEKRYVDFFRMYDAMRKEIEAGKTPDESTVKELRSRASNNEQRKLANGITGVKR